MSTNYVTAADPYDRLSESEQNELRRRILHMQSRVRDGFVGKDHIAELVVMSAIANEPLLLVGSPGAGKSAIVKRFARLVDVPRWSFLDYVVTRKTDISELCTPPSPDAPAGQVGGMALMTAQVVFLDEVFHVNSTILNPLLRRLSPWEAHSGIESSGQGKFSLVVAATRDLHDPCPNESLLDRFTLKVSCDTVNQDCFADVIRVGTRSDVAEARGVLLDETDDCSVFDIVAANHCVRNRLALSTQTNVGDADFGSAHGFADFERLIRRLGREDRVFVSDRKLIKLYKLLTAVAWLHGEPELSPRTLHLLSYIGNSADEMQILADKVPLLIDQL